MSFTNKDTKEIFFFFSKRIFSLSTTMTVVTYTSTSATKQKHVSILGDGPGSLKDGTRIKPNFKPDFLV